MTKTINLLDNHLSASHNAKWIGLCFIPFVLALSFLILPVQYFAIFTFFILMTLISLYKPETGAYLIVPLVLIFGNMIGFIYRADLSWRNTMMENGITIPIFSVFLWMECYVLFLRKSAKINAGAKVNPPLSIFLVFFTLFALSGFFWKRNASSLFILIILLNNIMLFFYIYALCLLDRRIFDKVIDVFIFCGGVIAVLVMYTVMLHPEYTFTENLFSKLDFIFIWTPGQSENRGYSFELSNFTSRTLNIASCLILGRMLSTSNRKKSIGLAFLLVFVFLANCLTISKGGLGAILVVACFFIVFNEKLNKDLIRNGLIIFSLIILVFLLSVGFAAIFGDIFRQTNIDVSGNSISISTRLTYWGKGFRSISREEAEFLGLGLGGFEYYSKIPTWAHNIYFSNYFDFGMIGILFLLLILFHTIRHVFKYDLLRHQKKSSQHIAFALVGGLAAIAIHGVVDFYYNNSINWLFLAILFAGLRYAADDYMSALQCEVGPDKKGQWLKGKVVS